MAAENMARGDYLVSPVAMCVQCHTPRDFTRRARFTLVLKHRPVRASGALPQIDL